MNKPNIELCAHQILPNDSPVILEATDGVLASIFKRASSPTYPLNIENGALPKLLRDAPAWEAYILYLPIDVRLADEFDIDICTHQFPSQKFTCSVPYAPQNMCAYH